MLDKTVPRPGGLVGLPLLPLQLALEAIVSGVARRRAELFERLGPHARSVYLIDPVDLPIVLVLRPDPEAPHLTAFWRAFHPTGDARIAGSFTTLLAIIDGRRDGDALFFSRDLVVEGDVEAVVTLRNALDDLDVPLAEDIAASAGLLRPPLQAALGLFRALDERNTRHAA
jgi:predicted lipid carrier protein YhbT